MATYSFKSVGKTQDIVKQEEIVPTPTAYGIKTPLQLGSSEIFLMNYDLEEQFADNFRNLLLTNWGERLGQYNFGANLRPITTELSTQDSFDNAAIERIKSATQTWMPYIDLDTFTSEINHEENKNTAVIKVNITYSIPTLSKNKKSLQIVLYAI